MKKILLVLLCATAACGSGNSVTPVSAAQNVRRAAAGRPLVAAVVLCASKARCPGKGGFVQFLGG
ncbi:MAG: hypothetical protein JO199_00705, partial [Candidatus Eremiobacteraeota bacterium]|nr:hypothetical protein [Candidatus Eremiobacteraeota bacterium]